MDESAAAAGDAGAGADDAAKLPQHTLLRRRQQQQQQGPQAAAGAAGEQQGPGAVPQAGNIASGSSQDTSSAGLLPSMQYRVLTAGPELLQVRVQLPGVTSASDVQVAVEPPGQQHAQQCLWLQVPGRFTELQLPLSQHLQPGQAVGAVSGRFYKKKQELKLKLSLSSVTGGQGGISSGSGGSSGGTLDFHLTDSFDTSSGSESEGYQPARRGSMRGVASERDLCSIFGRHSSTVAHQLMQQLQQQRGPGQAEAEAPAPTAAAAAPAAASKKPANKKKAAGKKKSKRK
jgi:hypothetical protein